MLCRNRRNVTLTDFVQNASTFAQVGLGCISAIAIVMSTWVAVRRDGRDQNKEEIRASDRVDAHDERLKIIDTCLQEDRKSINDHLIECARANGRLEEAMATLQREQKSTQRIIENLQAQFRMAVADASNHFFTKTDSQR